MTDARGASAIRWSRVNGEPFEYAIQQGPHGDEFVKLLDGTCLRRAAPERCDAVNADALRPMTEDGLLFVCDEAACKHDTMFYEMFTMDERWEIIRAILKAVETASVPSTHRGTPE